MRYGRLDESDPWHLDRIKSSAFYADNQAVLALPRGGGYWLWKPYIILESLKSMAPGDFVVYHDVGKPDQEKHKKLRFFRDIGPGLEFTANNGGMFPGVYLPKHGPNKVWTRRDCFLLMDCDAERFWMAPQIQATYNIWQKKPETIDFVEQWLAYCTDPRILTDQPNELGYENFPAFIGHRHDQSVLSLLCVKNGVRSLGSPEKTIFRPRNINFFVEACIDAHREQADQQEH